MMAGEVAIVPQLRGEDCDERLVLARSRDLAGPAPGGESRDRACREHSRARERVATEHVADPGRRSGAEEARRVGSAIGLFRAGAYRCRNDASGPPSQNLLLAKTPQARARWQCSGELEETVIEEWEAALHAMRHRHAVALRAEKVRRQQQRHFEIRRAIQRRPCEEARGQ